MMLPLILALLVQSSVEPAVAEKRLMLTGFDRVRVDGAFDVIVTAGSGTTARITGDARALDAVRVRVDGSTLVITPARGDRGAPERASALPLTIEVASLRLTSAAILGGGRIRVERMAGPRVDLSLTGSGTITVGDIDADRVNATVIGTGGITLTGRSRNARFLINGPATVDAKALVSDQLFVRSEGAGSGRYHARYDADITGLGAGTIDVSGTPRCRTQGTATIRCSDRP